MNEVLAIGGGMYTVDNAMTSFVKIYSYLVSHGTSPLHNKYRPVRIDFII